MVDETEAAGEPVEAEKKFEVAAAAVAEEVVEDEQVVRWHQEK